MTPLQEQGRRPWWRKTSVIYGAVSLVTVLLLVWYIWIAVAYVAAICTLGFVGFVLGRRKSS